MANTLHIPLPGKIDGTPYEVSYKSIHATASLIDIAADYLESAESQLLNTEMQRRLDLGVEDLRNVVIEWRDGVTPTAKTFRSTIADLRNTSRKLVALASAVSYDPKNPPKEKTSA